MGTSHCRQRLRLCTKYIAGLRAKPCTPMGWQFADIDSTYVRHWRPDPATSLKMLRARIGWADGDRSWVTPKVEPAVAAR
jgi:hypothetical protein